MGACGRGRFTHHHPRGRRRLTGVGVSSGSQGPPTPSRARHASRWGGQMSQRYIDFDVVITHGDAGYSLRLPGHVAGRAAGVGALRPAVQRDRFATFMVAVGPPRVTSRRLVPVTERVGGVKDLGQRLGMPSSPAPSARPSGRRRGGDRRRQQRAPAPRPRGRPRPAAGAVGVPLLRRSRALPHAVNRTPIVRLVKAFGVPPPAVVHPRSGCS